jgi:hypothetical protein
MEKESRESNTENDNKIETIYGTVNYIAINQMLC